MSQTHSHQNGHRSTSAPSGSPRCIALVGPHHSGKTTLLKAILERTASATHTDLSRIGHTSPEAQKHGMGVDLFATSTSFMGETLVFLDCPGSVEFLQEARSVLAACDGVIVVCENDAKKLGGLQLILAEVAATGVPYSLFLNKIDATSSSFSAVLASLQPASPRPLLMRQIPLVRDGLVRGCIDLALERAFVWRDHADSEVIEIPDTVRDEEKAARFAMLEKLADYDEQLMDDLLSDIEPGRDLVFADLKRDVREGLLTPVLFGSAANGNGIGRLLKAIRHEFPDVAATASRLGVPQTDTGMAVVLKTLHPGHGGKQSLVRVLRGMIADGAMLTDNAGDEIRLAGIHAVSGDRGTRLEAARAGDVVLFGRLDPVATQASLWTGRGAAPALMATVPLTPVFGLAVSVSTRKDDVKLGAALAKLIEEDPSLSLHHDAHTHEMVLWGQGEMHLRVTLERLARRFGLEVHQSPRLVAFRETIRKPVEVRGRHKKQSGGHGQYGDVVVEIRPLERGAGFVFGSAIVGGSVPKAYVPAVEAGVRDWMARGPLGFPVVDFAVTLKDGSAHDVDSSEMAFRLAARLAMEEGIRQCAPVLLEPIVEVVFHTPSWATARINQIVTSHRGHLLGFDRRDGWEGWDSVQAHMPESEIADLILEVRSATAGVGSFSFHPHHMAELEGRGADQVIATRRAVLAEVA